MALAAILLACISALAVEVDPDLTPTSGIASEDGPLTVWVNPANLAYDPDPRWVAAARVATTAEAPNAFGISAGIAGVSAGLRWYHHDAGSNDVVLDLAAGLRLPRRIAVGGALRWNIESGARNYVAFDAAASWRPLPWLGMSVIARNIGSPGSTDGAPAVTGGGLAVRPFGRALVVGADLLATFDDSGTPDISFAASTRIRPVEGLFLRARLDTHLTFGAGFEMFFGPAGFGASVASSNATDLVGAGGSNVASPDVLLFAGSDEPDEDLAPSRRAVPVVRLDRPVTYQPERRLLSRSDASWLEILEQLDAASRDPAIRVLVLSFGSTDFGWARWRELRSRVSDLGLAGRRVIVHLTGEPQTGALYAAAGATQVLIHPASVLDLAMPAVEELHLAGLLDAVGVDVQVVRSGPYKTAGEAYVAREPSGPEREQQLALLRTVEGELITAIAEGRGLPVDLVQRALTEGPIGPAEAVASGLVDGLAWPDEVQGAASNELGHRAHLVEPNRHARGRSPWDPPVAVAVINVEGLIVPGRASGAGAGLGGSKRIGSETITRQLQRAAEDPSVRAVVLRVESPGGSTFASEEIWRAVTRLRERGKPVVASLGNQATSGGYYAAVGADAIWAEPTTVTGSIGVIAMHASAADLLERLGVGVTVIRSGPGWDTPSPARSQDASELARTQALVDASYRTFIARVAASRHMDPVQVDEVARGRVWSGADARAHGLVDHTGGLIEAIGHARQLAGVSARTPVDVITIRPDQRLGELLLPDLTRLRLLGAAGLPPLPMLPPPLDVLFTLLQEGQSQWLIDPDLTQVH